MYCDAIRHPMTGLVASISLAVLAIGSFSAESGEDPLNDNDHYGAISASAAVLTLVSVIPMFVSQ